MNECFQLIFSGVVSLSTVIYAILTWKLVLETKKTRIFQITPDIYVYFEKAEANPKSVYLVIENMGNGVGKDVKIEVIKNFRKYEYEFQSIEQKGLYANGIKNFYPKQRYRSYFTTITSTNKDFINDSLELKLNYSDILGQKFEKILILTICELVGQVYQGEPDNYIGIICNELKEIKEVLQKNS